ncbi:hypothetical protein PT2222_250054 [Paraburkholderia tropica]
MRLWRREACAADLTICFDVASMWRMARLRRSAARQHDHADQNDADADEALHAHHFAEQIPGRERVDHVAEREHRVGDRDVDAREAHDPHDHAEHVAGESADDRQLRGELPADGQDVRTAEFEVSNGIDTGFQQQLRTGIQADAGQDADKGNRIHHSGDQLGYGGGPGAVRDAAAAGGQPQAGAWNGPRAARLPGRRRQGHNPALSLMRARVPPGSGLRLFHHHAARVARDHLHGEALRGQLVVALRGQQRQRVAFGLPALLPVGDGRHPFLRFLGDAEGQFVGDLDHRHRVAYVEGQRVIEHADRIERRVGRHFGDGRAHGGRERRAGTQRAEYVVARAGDGREQQPRGAERHGGRARAGFGRVLRASDAQADHGRDEGGGGGGEHPDLVLAVERVGVARVAEAREYERARHQRDGQQRIADQMAIPLLFRHQRQIEADDERERRSDRQRVRDQLRMRRAEEQEDEGAPDQHQRDRREAVRLARRAQRVAHALHAHGEPRQEADQHHRHEVIERAGAVLRGRQIALELLDDEEEVEELGIALLHQHKPRRYDREEHDQAAHEVEALPECPVARDQRVEHQHGARQDQADEALREHGERHRAPADPHPQARGVARQIGALGEQQRAEREFHPERQGHVERVEVTHQVPVRRAGEHDGGEEAGGGVEHARAGEADQQHAGEAGQRRVEARLPFADAEPRERQRVHPGLQGRLLEILVAVVARRDPVAGREHFARHFGIAAFVARQQMAPAERQEPDHGESDDQKQDRAAVERQPRGRIVHGFQPVFVNVAVGRVAAWIRASPARRASVLRHGERT